VTEEILYEFIEKHRWRRNDLEIMPPPSKMPRTH
jgi:hypothetical protein